MRNILLTIFLTLFLAQGPAKALGLKFHGYAKNSIYSFESDQQHTRIYQYARFSLSSQSGNISLNSSMRALTDTGEDLSSDQRFKMYSLRLNFRRLLHDRIRLTLGRQFLHPGTVLGALDGLNGTISIFKNLSIQFYGGVESHFQRSLKVYETQDSFVAGGVLQLSRLFSSRLQVLYLRKSNDAGTFWHLGGLNFATSLLPKTRLRMQGHYDIENQRMHRILVSARNIWSEDFQTTVEFKSQYPQVYANSFFTIFEPRAYDQYRLGADFRLFDSYYVSGQYQLVNFEDDQANRVFLTLQNANGSLGLIYESGYAGDQLGILFDYAYEWNDKLVASVYVDYSKYRTETIYEFENQLGNAVRLSYRMNRHLSVDLEYQWLTNKFKASDSRVLNHISYIW